MKKHLQRLLLLAALCLPWVTQAQTLEDYTFSTGTDATKWVAESDATWTTIVNSALDDNASTVQNIGFTFYFGEESYTQFSANSNGILRLGSTAVNTDYSNQFTSSYYTNNLPKICGISKDQSTGSAGYVRFATIGTAPNRTMVCEFRLNNGSSTSGTSYLNWQVQFHETSNVVELVYGTAAATPSSFQTGLSTASNDILLIDPSSHTATHTTTYSATTYSTWPGANRYYTFTRPVITCPKPSNLAISNLEPSSFTISWTDNANASSWVVRLDSASTTGTPTVVTTNPYTFTSITPFTDYTASVAALCGVGDTSAVISKTTKTPCNYLNVLPYSYDFEGATTGSSTSAAFDAQCMVRHNNGTQYFGWPYIYASANHTTGGNRGTYWYASTSTGTYGDYQIIVLPGIETNTYPINTLQLRFWAKGTSITYHPTFVVGVMTDPNDVNTFTAVKTINVNATAPYSTNWEECVASLANYTGTGRYVAIRANRPTTAWYAYVDDITLENADACPQVENLTVSQIGQTSATVSWTGTASSYTLSYGAGSAVTVNGTSYTLTDLSLNTNYTVTVTPVCSGTTRSRQVSFTTECSYISSLPYTMGFESGDGVTSTGGGTSYTFIPCWHRVNNGISNFGYPYVSSTAAYVHNGSRTLYWYLASGTGYPDYEVAVMPGIDTSIYPINTLQFKFWAKATSTSYYPVYQVGIMTDPDDINTFELVNTINVGNNQEWVEFTTTFNNYRGTGKYIAIRANRTGSTWYGTTDDFTIEEAPACPVITELTAEEVTATSASLTWGYQTGTSGVPQSYEVQYYAVGTANAMSATTSAPQIVLSGLDTTTSYVVRVRANCGNFGYGEWDSIDFTTPALPCLLDPASLDTINFSNGTTASSGILVQSAYGNTMYQTIFTAAELSAAGLSAGNIIGVDFGFGANTSYAKEFTIFMGPTTLTSFSSTTAYVNPNTLTQVYGPTAYPMHSSAGWRHFDLDTPYEWDGTSSILICTFMNQPTGASHTSSGFSGYSTSSVSNISIWRYRDNTQYTADNYSSWSGSTSRSANRASIHFYMGSCNGVNTCIAPTVAVTNVTSSSATISWAAGFDETAWDVEYRVSGASTWTTASVSETNLTYTFTGLTANTAYDFRVSYVCNNDTMATVVSATTPCAAIASLPYTYGFEGLSTSTTTVRPDIPCWHHLNNATQYLGYPQINSTYHTGTRGSYWYLYTTVGSYGDYQVLALPEMDVATYPINTLRLKFWAKSSNTSYHPEFIVGVMTDPTNINTFEAIATVNVEGTNWEEYTTNLSAYTGHGAYVALRANRASTTWGAYVDDFTLEELPPCVNVDNLTASNATASSITLSWSDYDNTSATYTILNGTTQVATGVTGTSYTVAGLNPGTTYTFSVLANCSATDTSEAVSVTAHTACAALASLPYTYDFEDQPVGTSNVRPDIPCWHHLNNATSYFGYPYISNSYNHTSGGSKCTYWYASTTTTSYGDYQVLVLPEVDVVTYPINTLRLKFWAKATSSSYHPQFLVGVMTDPEEAATFTVVDTINVNATETYNTNWDVYMVSLANYTGNGRYVALRADRPTSNWYACVDDITLEEIPNCLAPAITNVTYAPYNNGEGDYLATVTWDSTGTAYQIGVIESAQTSIINIWTNSHSFVISPEVASYVKIRAICGAGDTSAWSDSVRLYYGYCEPNPTSCDGNGITNVTFGTGSEIVNNSQRPTAAPYYGDYRNQIGAIAASTTANVAITYATGYDYGTIIWVDWNKNYVFDSNEVVYVGLAPNTNPTTLNATFNIPATQDTGLYRMRIVGADSYFNNYITSIAAAADADPCFTSTYAVAHDYSLRVTEAPACMAVTALTANASDSSVTLTWADSNNTGATYSVYLGSTLVATNIATTTYTHTGLTSNSEYTFGVVANCSANESSDTATVSFRTPCAAATIPFTEGFENGLSTCWSQDGLGSWSVATGDYSSSTGAHIGTYNAKISGNGSGNATKLITPTIDFTGVAAARLSFWHIQRSWSGDQDELRVYYRTSATAAWQQLVAYTNEISTWTEENVNLPNLSSTYQIAFEMTDGYGYGVAIDDITIDLPPSCPAPVITNVTYEPYDNGEGDFSASLTLDTILNGVSYQARWVENNGQSVRIFSHSSNSSFVVIPETISYVSVRAICGEGDTSEWSDSVRLYYGYCTPTPTSVDNNGITSVAFGGMTNTTAHPTAAPYYGNYRNLSGSVPAGTTATVDITYATSYTYGTIMWVDWNKNYVFDSNEVVAVGTSTSNSPDTLTLTFLIPATQDTGNYRMRIVGADSYFDNYVGSIAAAANANPCFSSSYAVAEDYTLHVTEAPACMTPTNLQMVYIGGNNNAAVVSWTSDASTWNLNLNGTVTYNITANPTTITGLDANTTYTVMVQSNCVNDTSDWTLPVSITTPCAAFTLPFNEGFENGTLSTCWSQEGSGTWSVGTGDYSSNTGAHSGTYNAKITHSTSGNVTKLITPVIDFTGVTAAELKFWHIQRDWSGDQDELRVYYRTSDTSAWDSLAAYTNTISTWTEETITLPNLSSTYQVSFEMYDGYGYGVAIDDISINLPPACAPVAHVTMGHISNTTAVVNWGASATDPISAYEVEVATVTGGPIDTVTATDTTATLTGLTASTTYNVRVRTLCNAGDTSTWSTPVSFSTNACDDDAMCPITVVMNDSYGDGWNGGALIIYDSTTNIAVATLSAQPGPNPGGDEPGGDEPGSDTIDNSTSDTLLVNLCRDRGYWVSYTSGEYDSEASFTIFASNGDTIANVSNPNAGYQAAFTHSCGTNVTIDSIASVPYTCDFEFEGNNGWVLENGTQVNWWMVGNATNNGGSQSLYITNDSSSNAYSVGTAAYVFATRLIRITEPGVYAYSYDWKAYGESSYDFIRAALVPASTTITAGGYNGFDNTSAVPTGGIAMDGANRLNLVTSWQTQTGEINVTDTGVYNIVFLWRNDPSSGTQPPAAIDNVTFYQPTCPMPLNVVANPTDNSITLTWTPAGNENAWEVSCGNTVQTVNTNTYTFTGLTANSDYTVGVRALCSATESSTTVSQTVHTSCEPITTLPYTYGFEGATTGSSTNANFAAECWRRLNNGTQYFGYPYISSTASYCHTGSRGTYWYVNTTTGTYGDYNVLVLPGVNTTTYPVNTLRLKFWTKGSAATARNFLVGVMTNPTDINSFTTVETVTVNSTDWVEHTVLLDSYTGTGAYVAIRQNRATSTYTTYIDDITLEVAPTCVEPANVTVDSITTNSALVAWTGTANAYSVAYGTGTNPDSMSTVSATGNSTMITGLTPNTAYNVYVKAICSATDQSPWTNATIFRTNCVALTANDLPYFENFDNYTTSTTAATGVQVPCWTLAHQDVSMTDAQQPQIYYSSTASYNHSGNYTLRLYYRGIYALPEITANINTLRMNFWVRQTTAAYKVIVGVMSDLNDATTFVPIDTIDNGSNTSTMAEHTVNFSSYTGNGHYIAFRNITTGSTSYSYNYIDDVTVEVIPSCEAPAITDVTYSPYNNGDGDYQATVTWSATGTSYQIGLIESAQTSIINIWTNSHSFVISPEVASYVKIRAICGVGDTSAWSDSVRLYYSYCTPTPTSRDNQGITSVAFGGMTNATAHPTAAPYYGNYRNLSGSVPAGTTATVDITYATGYSYGTIIWVDWNKNYVFDSNEVVAVGMSTSTNPTTLTLTFDIPATQDTGNYRMRIAGADSYFDSYTSIAAAANANPCFTSTYAVAEDYTLHVTEAPACVAVTNLAASAVTDNSVTLTWSDPLNSNATYTVLGANGVIASGLTATTYTVTGLTPNTDYSYSVVANCSATEASDSANITVHTECTFVATLPYTMGFETADGVTSTGSSTSTTFIDCWHRLNNGTQYFGHPYVSTTSSYIHTGARGLYWGNSTTTGTYGDYQCIVMPGLGGNYAMNGLQLKFWARATGTSYHPVLYVGVMTDPTDINSFVYVDTINVEGTTYTEYTAYLNNYTGNGRYVAIRANRPTSAWYLSMDDITLDVMPSCFPVTNLTIASTTTGSMTLAWNDNFNDGATYTVSNAQGVVASNVTGNSYTVTGLNAGTEYTFMVTSNCSATDSGETVSVTGYTACGTLTAADLPYSEDFESYGSGSAYPIHPCWTKGTNGSTAYPYPTSTVVSGTRSLYFYGNKPSSATGTQIYSYAALPQLDATLDASDLTLTFKARRYSTTTANYRSIIYVGVMTNPTDASTFVAVDTINMTPLAASSIETYNVNLASYTGTGKYVAFYCPPIDTTAVSYNYIYIDDVMLDVTPTCLPVAGITANNATANSVTLSWTDAFNTGATYTVYDMSDSTVMGTNITGTTYTVTGLAASSSYTFGVQAICSADDASPIMTVAARTACGVATMPWVENFDNWTAKSDCWAFLSGAFNNGAGTPTASTAAWALNSSYGDYITISGKALTMNIYSTYRYWAVTPAVSITSNRAQLSVDVAVAAWSAATPNYDANDTLAIAITTDSGLTYTPLLVYDNTQLNALTGTYTTITVPVTGYNGQNVRFAIFGGSTASGGDNRIVVDNVSVTEVPPCLAPTDLQMVYIGGNNNAAVVSWTSDANSWNLSLNGTVTYNITANPDTITGLDPNTTYTVMVQSNCGSDTSNWSLPVSITTPCAAFTLPFTENFESGTLSTCWSTDGLGTWTVGTGDYTLSTGAHTGTYNAKTVHGTTGNVTKLITPTIDFTGVAAAELRFWHLQRSWSGDQDELRVYYRASDTAAWQQLAAYTAEISTYTQEIIQLPNLSSTYQVAFEFTDGYGYGVAIDDITINLPPSCTAVTALTATPTDNSVVLSWSDANTSATYTVYDMSDSTVMSTGITGTTYTVTGLTANTLYTFGVVANCSATDASQFTTVNVRTNCSAFTVPYTWTFEDMDVNAAPLCWAKVGSGTTNVLSSTSYSHNSSKYLRFSGSTSNLIVLPEIADTISNLQMRLWTRPESTSNSSCGTFSVGYVTDASDDTTFVALDTYNYNDFTGYDEKTVRFNNAPTGARMALRHTPNSTSWYWFVDDVTVEEIPSCMPVTGVAVTEATFNTVGLIWNSVAGAASYTVYNMADTSVVAANVTDTVYTVTGLTAETNYLFGVLTNCSATSSAPYPVTVDAFTGYCQPNPTSVDGSGITSVAFGSLTNDAARPSTAGYRNYSNLNGTVATGSPVTVDITYATGYDYGTIIWVDWDNSITFDSNEVVYVGTSASTNPTTLTATFDIPADQALGSYRMRILGADSYFNNYTGSIAAAAGANPCASYSWGVAEDYTLTLVLPSACPNVGGFAVTGVTNNSVSLEWNSVADATYTLYNDTTVVATGITDTVYTVTGLTANTDYTFGVEANCSATSASAYPAIVNARTLCDNVTLPFVESFDSSSTTRNCWDFVSNNTANIGGTYGMGFVTLNGNTVWRFSSYSSASDYNQYAYSPLFNTPTTGNTLRVRVRYATNGNSDHLWFGYRTANDTDYTWTPNYYTTTGQNDFQTLEALLPLNVAQLAIHYYGDYAYYAWIDSVELTPITCPTDTTVVSVLACDSYLWNDIVYTSSGTYAAVLTTANGCDSNVVLNLTIDHSAATTDVVNVCDSYLWNDSLYTVSTTLTDSLTTTNGCDSIVTVQLTVRYSTSSSDTVSAFNSYVWNGNTYMQSGIYTYTTLNAVGCDSVATLVLTVTMLDTVTLTVNDTTMGSVRGAGVYTDGDTITLYAVANTGYHFTMWSDGDTNAIRTIVLTDNMNLTAYFAINQYTIALAVNDTLMGIVRGAGVYNYGDTAVVTAVANTGYHFVNWSDNDTNALRALVVTDNVNLTANFAVNQYTLTVAANDSTMGSVTGSGVYNYGATATLTATADSGFHFQSWNDGNVQNPRTVIVTGDASYTAIFVMDSVPPVPTYTVTLAVNDTLMGSVLGAGVYMSGSQIAVSAIANYGYHFTMWSDGDTNNPRTLTVTSDTTLTATFAVNQYTLTVTSDTTMGSVTGAGTYNYGATATLTATANTGYHFTMWSDGDTNATRTIVMTADMAFTAYFAVNQYTIALAVNDTTMGRVRGAGLYNYGDTATLTAVANYGYHFMNWSDNDTNAIRTVVVTGDMNLTANFAVNQYTVALAVNDTLMGSVRGAGVYNYGDTAVLTAVANYGYHFVNWSDNDTNALRTVVVTADMNLTANFAVNQYTLTVAANDSTMGRVTGAGVYNYGATATLTAVANNGYHFTMWNDGDTNSTRTVVVIDDMTLTAYFAVNQYTIALAVNDSTMGTVRGAGVYNYGDTAMLIATANNGYHFVNWSDNDTNELRTVVVTDNMNLTANFAVNQYTLTVAANDTTMGSVTGAGLYNYGATATLTATADSGFHFQSWNDGNVENPRTVVVLNNASYTAIFVTDSVPPVQIDTVTLTVNDTLMGSVHGAGAYVNGSQITVTAVANYGYHFTMWNDGDTNNPRTLTVTSDTTLTALFAANQYTVALAVNDTTMGSVTGANVYTYGDTATLTAVANTGYHFTMWSDGDTNAIRTIVVTADMAFTAYFAINQYTVALAVNDSTMGSVRGAGVYNYGDTATLTAVAYTGYHFVNWSDNDTNAIRTIVVTADVTLTATFATDYVAPDSVTFIVNVNDSTMGTTVPAPGTYRFAVGDTASVQAVALTGHHFTNWTMTIGNNTQTLSVNPLTTVVNPMMANQTYTLTANFNADSVITRDSVTIVLTVNDTTRGTTTPAPGTYRFAVGDSVYAVATPNTGYRFLGWSIPGLNNMNTDNPIRMMIPAEAANLTIPVTANFVPMGDDYYSVVATPVTTDGEVNAGGTITGNGTYPAGSNVTLTAMADEGYRFVGWYSTSDSTFDMPISTEYSYSFVIMDNVSLLALFTPESNPTAVISIATADSTMGYVLLNNDTILRYIGQIGEEVTIEAIAYEGYRFVAWSDGDTNALRTIVLDMPVTSLTARFEVIAVGIDDAEEAEEIVIYTENDRITVRGAENRPVYVFDVVGRLVAKSAKAAAEETFRMTNTGIYMVKVGNAPARRVVVRR